MDVIEAENACAAPVLKDFENMEFSSKKVLTKRGYPAIIINVVASDANAKPTTTAILENDTEKVILYKK